MLKALLRDFTQNLPLMTLRLGQEVLNEFLTIGCQVLFRTPRPVQEHSILPDIPKALREGRICFGTALGEWGQAKVYFKPNDTKNKLFVGSAGSGKTVAGMNFVLQCKEGGVAFLDNSDGEAVETILKSLPPDRLDKLVILDHSDPYYPIPLGLSACQTSDIFEQHTITQQWVDFFEVNFDLEGQHMTTELLTYACKAVFAIPGATIADVIRIVQEVSYREWVLQQLKDPATKQWWQVFMERNTPIEILRTAQSFLRRANLVLSDPVLYCTLGETPVPLDYRKWMDEGYTVLIKVPESLGKNVCRIIMRIHAINFWQTALSRDDIPKDKRRIFYLITDEKQTWLSKNADRLDDMFSKARKYGFRVVMLFQSFRQITKESPALLDIMLANEPDLLIFRTTMPHIDLYPLNPETIPRYHFIARVDDNLPFLCKALGVPVPFRADCADILAQQRKKYNVPYQVVLNNIERRVNQWQGVVNLGGGTASPTKLQQETKKSSGGLLTIG